MIERHAANSAWWGADVGIVRDGAFFGLPAAEREAQLAPWAWAEWRAPLEGGVHPAAAAAARFWWADVQVGFRLGLRTVQAPGDGFTAGRLADPAARPAQPFLAERYLLLAGATPAGLAERYARWAGELAAADPDWAVEVSYDGEPQGWFCATPGDGGLRLTLAALYEGATASGLQVYRAAAARFAEQGARIGWAAFSVRNAAVMNLYAALGARFGSHEAVWLWEPQA